MIRYIKLIDEVSDIDDNYQMDYDENSIASTEKSNEDEVVKDDSSIVEVVKDNSSVKCKKVPTIRK